MVECMPFTEVLFSFLPLQIKEFLMEHPETDATSKSRRQCVQGVDNNIKWITKFEPKVAESLRGLLSWPVWLCKLLMLPPHAGMCPQNLSMSYETKDGKHKIDCDGLMDISVCLIFKTILKLHALFKMLGRQLQGLKHKSRSNCFVTKVILKSCK